ncbi:DUF4376 domain-containing protein [Pseudoalteromonas byunsanensis]|uniref:DUF4376 domain-containing protein n=1 Tax=Pseudoalteromonas byunsanensis TaxID=327939 RepID=A0A1S1N6G5_9GAMM|nr:DUF4376 domain-containing protein [Pseudoalteromonas byunsanensis]OHU96822.1 hypothetical protein BIW53_05740 [Pseudoalteromonas byunsanensis]
MEQTNEQTASAVETTVPDAQQTEQQVSPSSTTLEVEATFEQPQMSYEDVLTKIALRHPQEQVEQALQQAIEQEQAAYTAAYQQWELDVVEAQEQRQEALAYNASLNEGSEGEAVEVPELPAAPQIDMSLRRACYRKEYVEVDLALSTEQAPARTEYDDDACVVRFYPATEAHSQEQIAMVKRERFKQSRSALLAQQTVEVDGMMFDADELSQQRMARKLLVMEEQSLTSWVLANNDVVQVSKEQLFSACKLASEQQTALWIGE